MLIKIRYPDTVNVVILCLYRVPWWVRVLFKPDELFMKWENHYKNTRNGTWFIILELTFSFSVGATAPAPALPPRRAPKCSGYENLPSKGAQSLPSREPPCEGYVNIPARPDVCTSNGPPPLPPKAPPQGLQGYENLPTKNASSLRTRSPYQNIGANGMMFTILSSVDPLVNFVKH